MSCNGCGQLRNALRGARKIATLAISTKRVDDATYLARCETCRTCGHFAAGWCGEPLAETSETCGCRVFLKARLVDETCPAGKWPVESETQRTL